jgi:hypothetical protein
MIRGSVEKDDREAVLPEYGARNHEVTRSR